MGSSGGTQNFRQPNIPTPPNVAEYGSSAPFNPSFINFLGGDAMQPYTGITPDQMAQIAAGQGSAAPPADASGGGGDRGLLAQIMAKLEAMGQNGRGFSFQNNRQIGGGGNRAGSAGYSTSGRAGAGGFGSRSSSASRAGGGLY